MKKVFLGLICLIFASSVFAQAKNALLIANADYQAVSKLDTPVLEARELKAALETIGFTVNLVENASQDKMYDALSSFSTKTKTDGGIGFFHYGGHAVQVNGENYLIPVDADIPDELRIKTKTVNVEDVMNSLNGETNIVILDSCRNNPLRTGGRGSSRGLSLVEVKPKNSIIVYSAESGKTAQDGVFTPSLVSHITEQKSFHSILMAVRRDVKDKTGGKQSPGEYNQLYEDVYLAGYQQSTTAGNKATTPVVATTTTTVTPTVSTTSATTPIPTTTVASTITKTSTVTEPSSTQSTTKTPVQTTTQTSKKDEEVALEVEIEGYLEKAYECLEDDDYKGALSWLKKAADKGNMGAVNSIGSLYYYGNGVSQNYNTAYKYYLKAAQGGSTAGMYNVATAYFEGEGVTQDEKQGFKWMMKAAELDDRDAQFYIGYCYDSGIGCTKNNKTATKWYEKAAEQGHASALYCLGYNYYYGEGVEADLEKALEMLKAAAGQDNGAAYNMLGNIYYSGDYVDEDMEKAEYYYRKGAALGNEYAIESLKEFE